MLIDPSVWQSTFIPADILEGFADDPFLKQLVVSKAGYFPKAAGHRMERTGIDEHILIHCLDGAGWVEVAGRRWPLAAGGLAICPAGQPHAYAADSADPWTIRWVHFRGDGCIGLLEHLGLSTTNPVLCAGPSAGAEAMLRDCCRILGGGYSYPLLLRASLSLASFLAALLAPDAGLAPAEGCRSGERSELDAASIIRLMLGHLDQALSLDRLAAMAGYSRYHFCRSFHRQTGYPPMDYFTRLKIQRACEMLETTPQSARAISEGLAFASPYYFSAVFKRITGMPPSEYRLRHRERPMV